jgi:hypothetical protein
MLLRIRTQAVQTTLAESIALAPPEFLQCTSVGTFVSTASHSDQLYVGSPLETWFILYLITKLQTINIRQTDRQTVGTGMNELFTATIQE